MNHRITDGGDFGQNMYPCVEFVTKQFVALLMVIVTRKLEVKIELLLLKLIFLEFSSPI